MKKILLVCLCVLLVLGMSACTMSEDDNQETKEPEQKEEVGPPLTLVSDGKTSYTLIFPNEATDQELNAVSVIYGAFLNDMSVEIDRKQDTAESDAEREAGYKILVGQTNYPLSKQAYEGLRYHDFRIVTDETSLAIAFYSLDGYFAAIKWLRANLFANFSKGELVLQGTNWHQEPEKGYTIESWTIGEHALKEYKIVYAEGLDREQVVALRDSIAKKTGWILEVVSDKDAEPSAYEILIGDTNRAESAEVAAPALHFAVKTQNQKLVLKTGGKHSIELLLKQFDALMLEDADSLSMGEGFLQEGNFFDDPYAVKTPDDADLRILCANVLAEISGYNDGMKKGFAFERRLEIFFAALDYYQPTVVGLQEFCMSWYEGVKDYHGFDKWEVLKFQNPKLPKEYVLSTIMYRTDLYSLLDSGMTYYSQSNNGRCRCITWAVLKDRTTGTEFCVVSTHWDGGNGDINGETANTLVQVEELSAFVNEMAEKYTVFTMGDFNRNEYTNAFKSYLSNINSVDAMYAAQNRLNVAGSYHNWGSNAASAGSCDHITATKDVTFLTFETLMYNQQIYASDHAWLVADVKWNR